MVFTSIRRFRVPVRRGFLSPDGANFAIHAAKLSVLTSQDSLRHKRRTPTHAFHYIAFASGLYRHPAKCSTVFFI